MVTLLAVGVLLIALGPTVGITLVLLLPRPHLTIIGVLSAFFYILALSVSAVIWHAIPPAKETYPYVLAMTALVQEFSRLGLHELFQYLLSMGDGADAFLRPGPINVTLTGIAVGTGFGLISVLTNLVSFMADHYMADSAIYTDKCPINFFVAAGTLAAAYSILHVLLAVWVWPFYTDRNWLGIAAVIAVHIGVAEASLGSRNDNGCRWTLGMVLGMVAAVGLVVVVSTMRRVTQGKRSL
ncbi:hypothetical protein BU14_0927s0002 [Porphyra umbilicalis]|uniref:Aph-1 n=1 Tax=Porphyra umbilicalis TaxID=2786 RepID=A0A1X6NN64_PORUM|nr:hypothetical protein BU14_0927s0002 [Porphyra umbilicalis]|eukprot:OSX70079.1 hypothetical protein BU14_0927s0002 [Porphyra umbilicalis]